MTKKFSQLTAISNVGDTPGNVIFGISNTASGTSNTITLSALSTYLDSTFATDLASQANVGAGLITVTAAYQANVGTGRIADVASGQANVGIAIALGQANVGAGIITVTAAYQANTGAAALAGQANVGAGLITVTSAYQANVGAGRLADVASGQANVGAGLITTKAAYEANVGAAALAGQANVGASVITLTNHTNNAFNQANNAYTAANTALNISQNLQISNYILQLTDRGKHIYSTITAGTQVITIPNFATVAWPTGTVIDIVLNGTGKINVATSTSVNLYVANTSTLKGYANVYPQGWATLLYVSEDTWFIKGQGVD